MATIAEGNRTLDTLREFQAKKSTDRVLLLFTSARSETMEMNGPPCATVDVSFV